jgi:hypothetical protein
MIDWQFFPKSKLIPIHLNKVVDVFEQNVKFINSKDHKLNSNQIMSIHRAELELEGFIVEKSKKYNDKIKVPVLFGRKGEIEKYFEADAYNVELKTVIEIEAGRAVSNYQFLKDLFQACMMHEVNYLVISVRIDYRGNPDFKNVISFFETIYASGRLTLPLKGILIIGY